jgi:hypothetical protein
MAPGKSDLGGEAAGLKLVLLFAVARILQQSWLR